LAAELVRRQVNVIAASATTAAPAAKAATATIPIAFVAAQDPVRLGLVASLARPGGNITGINFFGGELAAKRLDLLHELLPRAVRVAVLVNPADAANAASTSQDVEAAARAIGLQVQVLNASTSGEINAAFENVGRDRPDALFVGANTFLTARRNQVVQLAAFHRLPAVYPARDYIEVGGLMSYGASVVDAYRQMGVYTGRILKGAKPADLPVVQSSKFDLVINAEAARMLSLTVPPSLLASADEVIE
jgi:putative tryptophan/tyrosine transport system substrate-binding protein